MILKDSERNIVKQGIESAIGQIDKQASNLGDMFPSPASKNNKYQPIANNYWTTSFYTGLQVLCYQYTKKDKYKDVIDKHLVSFHKRLEDKVELDTHDLGFLYEYSSMAAYKLFGNKEAKADALKAADLLMERYHGKAGIIQAWGDLRSSEHRGRMIIDANMNLPLLYWASEVTGDNRYYNAAYQHVKNAQKFIMREDNSTYHTYYFEADSGEPLRGSTQQGFADDSCWARGQAWAIYGFTLSYNHTKDTSFIKTAMDSADYFISHLPQDLVCYWDLIFTEGDEQERDSSSAAIVACGLMELSEKIKNEFPEKAYEYTNVARKMILSLINDYTPNDENIDGLILHSVYSKPHNKGINECTTWGDYYYMEALLRMVNSYHSWI